MNTRDWALIIFTIFAQMSVGSFLVLGVIHFFARRKAGEAQADLLSDVALYAIGPVLVLGMVASVFHLGHFINAPRAVTNVATSWLSREILCGVLFAITGAIFAFLQWKKIATSTVRFVVALIAAVIGLALVYSISNVYLLQTEPIWNTFATPLSFFTTTFLLGSLAVGVAFVASYTYNKRKDPGCADQQCELLRSTVYRIAMASMLLLGVELITLPLQFAYLVHTGSAAGLEGISMLFSQFGALFILRLVLVFIGAGVFGLLLYRSATTQGTEKLMGNLVYSAFAMVLVAEVIGRYLFYATKVHLGL
jgi:anaerobic dimethyl sulfoxide reductase subunit C (anchor subunit)